MTQDKNIEMPPYLNASYEGDDLFSGRQLIDAVLAEREACAKVVGEFAQKWWSIHCDSNKHMETTRKAHDDFCALQIAIRAREEQA